MLLYLYLYLNPSEVYLKIENKSTLEARDTNMDNKMRVYFD